MGFCGRDLRSNNSVVAVTDETDKARLSRRCPCDLSTSLRSFFGTSRPLDASILCPAMCRGGLARGCGLQRLKLVFNRISLSFYGARVRSRPA